MGTFSLKYATAPEFADFPSHSIWLGGLHVQPQERHQGIGTELLKFAHYLTKQCDEEKLYFYTSNSDNVNWYLKNGAHIIETRSLRNHCITLMFL